MRAWIIVAALGLPASVARADHHGMAMDGGGADEAAAFGATLALVAAAYSTPEYVGNYQGAVPAVSWGTPDYAVGATIAVYRLEENGLERYGPGDLGVHGTLRLYHDAVMSAGLVVMVTAPTGDMAAGLGMGHTMAMPAGWGAWQLGRATLAASLGYTRALGTGMSRHDHGPWPLVEPMNMSELSWSASADVAVGEGIHGGVRATGGVPVGAMIGSERVIGGVRIAWGTHGVETAAELQVGLVGDPFTIRGLVETALHF